MKYLHSNTLRRSEDDLSVSSSLRSIDSYEFFGSPGSEYSDCEFCEERRRQRVRAPYYSPVSTSSNSYYTAMEKTEPTGENTPLLNTAALTPPYKYSSLSNDTLGPADLSPKAIKATFKKLEKQKDSGKKEQSSLVTIFSLWNTTMGSSLLTMAWGVERAGLFPALVLLVLMGGLCLFTAYILITINRHHGGASCEVPALCRTLLGRWAELVAHTFSLIVLLGANVVYWILITNFLYFTVNYFTDITSNATELYNNTILCSKHVGINGSLLIPDPGTSGGSPYWDLHSAVPIYVAVIVFPLLNFRSATFFTKFNSLGTLSVLYLLIFVTVKASVWGININSALVEIHAGKEAAVLSGMLALSFYIHNIIITIMNGNARQENNGRDLTIAFVLVTLTYCLVGAVYYVCFPLVKSCIEDNILNNFEMHDVMTAIARILLLFQVVTVYPLVAFMLRTEAILLLPIKEYHKKKMTLTVMINIGIVVVCILFACFCPNIGNIIRYTGAVSGLVHIFALPSLLQIRSLYLRGKLTCLKALLYITIILIGAVNLLMQFFISE